MKSSVAPGQKNMGPTNVSLGMVDYLGGAHKYDVYSWGKGTPKCRQPNNEADLEGGESGEEAKISFIFACT